MKSKSKNHYIDVWNSHINELTHLLYESTVPVTEWNVILLPLRNSVIAAANKLEAEGFWVAAETIAAAKTVAAAETPPVHHGDPIIGYIDGYIASDQPPFAVYRDRGGEPKGNRRNCNWWFQIGDEFFNVHPKTTLQVSDPVINHDNDGYPAEFDDGYPVRWIQSDDPRK